MSVHQILDKLTSDQLLVLLGERIRPPDSIIYENGIDNWPTHVAFVPDLTVAEIAVFTRLMADLLRADQAETNAAAIPA